MFAVASASINPNRRKISPPSSYRLRIVTDPTDPDTLLTDAQIARLVDPAGRVHDFLGAHPRTHGGREGTVFAVWAPGAASVSVVGDFNEWRAGGAPLLPRDSGIWVGFVAQVGAGDLYKYHIVSRVGGSVSLKADPCGRAMQLRPNTASVVPAASTHEWKDAQWLLDRTARTHPSRSPMSTYEVHLGSWRRHPGARPREGEPRFKSYRELADELVPYVSGLGFTHIELLPITEHPYDASWGYQTIGYFAPTVRHGTADDLRYLIDKAHRSGVGVILDWVPAHFPRDPHGLGQFDGTHLYEHADPRRGVHPDWGTYIFNYGRAEVVAFLVSSALYWIESFHIDGIRLDAVASMLYLDYSRDDGAWLPNEFGGRENIEAVDFLRILNRTIHEECPGVVVIAEESGAWPGVTHAPDAGGLGFDMKWNMGWMHDTLEVFQADPLLRSGLYDKLTFGLTYAFGERYILAFSHDEVVHLKKSMLQKMPGSPLDKFAGLRLLYGYMWTQPGKKLLFMGSELAVWYEWDVEGELDWALADEPMHAGMSCWLTDLNALYREAPELHETDSDGRGYEWLDCHDRDRTTLSYLRWSADWQSHLVVVANFTPVTWDEYRVPVPFAGGYDVVLCSDDAAYGGAGALSERAFATIDGELFGHDQWIEVALPPLSVVVLRKQD